MNLADTVIGDRDAEREWIAAGDPDCVHYWVGTGDRSGGRERFECRYCRARMTEPLELAPARRRREKAPRGFAACGRCGGVFHWTRIVRGADRGGRVCMDCLEEMVNGGAP